MSRKKRRKTTENDGKGRAPPSLTPHELARARIPGKPEPGRSRCRLRRGRPKVVAFGRKPLNFRIPSRLAATLARTFHTSGFGAPIFNRLSTSSWPQSRLQVGAPDCWHFVRSMKYPGLSSPAPPGGWKEGERRGKKGTCRGGATGIRSRCGWRGGCVGKRR